MNNLLQELDRRWRGMFSTLVAGDDLSPGRRLRAEGLMEAAVLVGAASEEDLTAAMDRCYREVFGRSLAEQFGPDWRQWFPFPQIPGFTKRAPVFPTTPINST